MRKCLHCKHEGPDDTFTFYKDVKGNRRPRNTCLECYRFETRVRQARYKEKHGDRLREDARNQKYDRYHSDPEFRQKCLDGVKKSLAKPKKKSP